MIFYIHGFASAPFNRKALLLLKYFPKEKFMFLDYKQFNYHGQKSLDYFLKQVDTYKLKHPNEPITFIGLSLGGYWANYLSYYYGANAILINPSINPSETVQRYVGWQINHLTKEPFYFEQSAVDTYNIIMPIKQNHIKILLLLNENDDVFDYKVTEKHYKGRADIHTFSGGGHIMKNFESDGIPLIKTFLEKK